jgi:hypothetical protein
MNQAPSGEHRSGGDRAPDERRAEDRDAEGPDAEDRDLEDPSGRAAATVPETAPEPAAVAARRAGAGRRGIAWLAAVLVLLIAGVAASPFWAPAIMPLLPWGERAALPPADHARAARLEAIEQRPVASAAALAAVQAAEAGLAQRLDRLEARGASDSGTRSAVTAVQSGLERLGRRLDAVDAQSTAAAGALQQVQRDVTRLDKRAADLGNRVGALDSRTREIGAGRTEAALLLSLMQLREAVERGRPYAAEYAGFAALAQGRADLTSTARSLAGSAGSGIASRAALRQGLDALAGRLAAAPAPPPARQKWWQGALSGLRGLVTVRRVDAPLSGGEAAVDKAQAAFAVGDLPGAVAALGGLSGADAAAAQPWLQSARARLAAETTLDRLQALLAAGLGSAPAAPTAAPAKAAPSKNAPAPAKPGTPS